MISAAPVNNARTIPRIAPETTEDAMSASTIKSKKVILKVWRVQRVYQVKGVCLTRWTPGTLQTFPCEQAISLKVSLSGGLRDFGGQRRRGRLLMPVKSFEIVAHELLIERGL